MAVFELFSNFPSSILKDFQAFLDYFLKKEVKLTASGFLTGRVCYELNEQMTVPQLDVSTRTRHFYYHQLYLFYVLASNGQLLLPARKGKSVKIRPNLDRVEEFFDLSDTEQYIALLEILWMQSDWEVLNEPERRRSPASHIHRLLQEVASMKPKSLLRKKKLENLRWDVWPFTIYLECFGFWEADHETYDTSRMSMLSECRPSAFGIDMAKILTGKRRLDIWNKWEVLEGYSYDIFKEILTPASQQSETEEAPDSLTKPEEPFLIAFQALFPEGDLLRSMTSVESGFREGNHIFHLTFKHDPKVSRKIAMPAKASLDDLHLAIQHAIDFDNDHLYSFYLDNKRYSRLAYHNPWGDMPPFADEILLADLPIMLGQPFLYFFDYGASWEFEVVLEDIDTEAPPLTEAKVIESKGKAPAQYGNYEEEW